MTEAEWFSCDYPAPMLIHLRGEVSAQERAESKSSLHGRWGILIDGPSPFVSSVRFARFAAACIARSRLFPLDEDLRQSLDGDLGFWRCDTPLGAGRACWRLSSAVAWAVAKDSIAITCAEATEEDRFAWGFSGGPPDPLFQRTQFEEGREQARLLREIIGNPFHPVAIDSTWTQANERAAVRIAREIDDEEAFHQTPILADALEDAGCTDEVILSHLRGPGPHAPGCWVVDLILGKP
jgi:hypothetical protein